MKRVKAIVTKFTVDGINGVKRAVKDVSKTAQDAAKATDSLSSGGMDKLAAGASAADARLEEATRQAKELKAALANIGVPEGLDQKGVGKFLDAENKAKLEAIAKSRKEGAAALSDSERAVADVIAGLSASDRNAGARRAAQEVDVSGIDPTVAKRAVAAYRKALEGGVELELYVDEEKSVRLVRDQLRALERKTGKLNIEAFDEGAIRRAAEAIRAAAAEGRTLAEYVDASTGTVFDAEQLAEVAKHAAKTEKELDDAADEAKRLAKEEEKAAREARRLELRALAVGLALGLVAGAAAKTAAGVRTLGSVGYSSTRRLVSGLNQTAKGLTKATKLTAKLTAGLTAAAAVKVGGAAAFAIKSGQDTVEKYRQARNVSSLTGMTVQEVELWERFGASVGLEGTDLGQVFSGFTAAIREAGAGGNDTAKAFDKLGVSVSGAAKSADLGLPKISSLWPSISKGADKANGKFRKTNDLFLEFLNNSNKLSKEERGQLFTQVFGEDDALKVAEIADQLAANGGKISGALGKGLVSNQELAQIKRYQSAVLGLGNTWDWFKRKLFIALEPSMTWIARFLDARLIKASGVIIRDYFVRPLTSALRSALKFIAFMDASGGWQRVNRAIQHTFATVAKLLDTFGKLGLLVFRTFKGGGSAEATYLNFLIAVRDGLRAIDKWAADGRGEKALLAFADAAKGLWGVFKALLSVVAAFGLALDDVLKNNGIDLSKLFSVENLRGVFVGAMEWVAAFIRDMSRIFGGEITTMETALGRSIQSTIFTVQDAIAIAKEWISETVEEIVEETQKRIASLVAYVQKAWEEASTGGNGQGFDGITTSLGKLLYVAMETFDWIKRLVAAFKEVFILKNDAPEGFQWLQDIRDIFGQIWTAVVNIHRALQPVISAIDSILQQLSTWNTATVLLAGVITAKLVGAFRGLLALFGIGGGAAGAGAAGGGILGGIAAFGRAILGLVSGPVGALLAAFGLVAGAVSLLSSKMDETLQKSMDLARLNMDASYEKYGPKNGLTIAENDARRASLQRVGAGSYSSVYGNDVNREIVYGPNDTLENLTARMEELTRRADERAAAKTTAVFNIDGKRTAELSGPSDQVAALGRALQTRL